jgi:catechol 2,3-dioxygenase-like lactoylglutathione lyase family enzyme
VVAIAGLARKFGNILELFQGHFTTLFAGSDKI